MKPETRSIITSLLVFIACSGVVYLFFSWLASINYLLALGTVAVLFIAAICSIDIKDESYEP